MNSWERMDSQKRSCAIGLTGGKGAFLCPFFILGIDFLLCVCYSLFVPQKWGVGLKFGVYDVPKEKRSLMAPFFLDILHCIEYNQFVAPETGCWIET